MDLENRHETQNEARGIRSDGRGESPLMLSWIALPEWRDVVDIALVAGFGWLAIRSFRRTRARAALTGLAFVGVVYFIARALELQLTASLLQAFFAVAVLVLVVIFQEDLRRVFEQIGNWRTGRQAETAETRVVDLLVRSVVHLASIRSGALLVIPGAHPLERHIEGGITLNGRISEPLLLSLFDKTSPGHDGAVLIRDDIVERFAIHLPLSTNHAALGQVGTRHAAALGLAERCDAICIVVSEERGTVSIARDGKIRTLARPEDLMDELRSLTAAADERPTTWRRGGSGRDAVFATLGAMVLWLVFVPGSNVTEKTVTVPIEVTNLPSGLDLEEIDPTLAEVTLRGLRRDLLLSERDRITVQVDAYLARIGRRTFTISEQDVDASDDLSVISVSPDRVRLSLKVPDGPPAAAVP
jgi:uncharacterized protein (TIGR00159 family)